MGTPSDSSTSGNRSLVVSSSATRWSRPTKTVGTSTTYTNPVKKPVRAVNVGWLRCHQLGGRSPSPTAGRSATAAFTAGSSSAGEQRRAEARQADGRDGGADQQ